jgi:D-sedoheptulose 7-phosphate isomerase
MSARQVCEAVSDYLKETDFRTIKDMASAIFTRAHRFNSTVWLVGNGGSSATMSHLASDLTNFGIRAICLTDNVPALTAKTNDDGWDNVYVSIVRGIVKVGDILIMASVNGSSGKSPNNKLWSSNMYSLAEYFKQNKCYKYAFIGNDGGNLKDICELYLCIKDKNPYIVEGIHSVWAHALVSEIKLFKEIH